MSQPEHEREKEVALLRQSVAEKERARAASDVLCRSLADETHQLRRTLAATAHMCQHLAKCLDERQRAQGASREKSPEVSRARGRGGPVERASGQEGRETAIPPQSRGSGHPEPTSSPVTRLHLVVPKPVHSRVASRMTERGFTSPAPWPPQPRLRTAGRSCGR